MKVAIIGSGFTGLVAAYELSKKSKNNITLFESSDSVGGLASGFEIEGYPIEKAYHHIFRSDQDIIELMAELGIEDKLKWFDSSVANYSNGKLYPFSSPKDLLSFTPMTFLGRIRLAFVSLYCSKKNHFGKLIDSTAFEWMTKWAGKNVVKVLWEPLLKGKFSEKYYKKVSMAWLWARIHTRVGARNNEDIQNEKLGYIEGGFQTIVEALKRELRQKKVTIKTHSKITSIAPKNSQIALLIENTSAKKMYFDKVIVTVPSSVFSKLISDLPNIPKNYISKLNSVEYIGAICGVFSSTQKLSNYYWHNILDTTSPFLVFINHTNFAPKSWYNDKYVYYIGTYQPHDSDIFTSSESAIKQNWLKYLKKIFPEFDKKKISEFELFKFRNAQHIVDTDYLSKIPKYKTPIKNVYLSNFSQIFPEDRGTNFAVREGRKIAKLV